MAGKSRVAALVAAGPLVFALAFPAPAHAEEAAEEQPVITVYGRHEGYQADTSSAPTKTDTPLIDVPQSLTVLNRAQLDDQGVDSLGEALRYVPGVVLGQGEGHRDQVTLRGQNSTADFFIDGLRDDAQYYRPLYATERVEVLKGANAMIFGRGGGGGVVNRVSKVPDFANPVRAGSASLDSFGAWTLAADLGQPLSDQAALRFNATREQLSNHRDGFKGHFTGTDLTLALRPGEDTRIALSYEFGDDDRVTDRGIPSRAGQPLRGYDRTFFGKRGVNQSDVRAHIGRMRAEHTFSESLTANLTAQFAHYDKFYANVYPRGPAGTDVEFEGYSNTTRRENAIVQGNLVWTGESGPVGHTVLAGFEAASQDTADARRLAQFGTALTARTTQLLARDIALPEVRFGAPSRTSRSQVDVLSFYVQDQAELGEHLMLVAGLRHDRFRISSRNLLNSFYGRRSDSKWSPRLGLIVKPRENVSLYASWAKSFLPQSGDQFTVLDPVTETLAPESFRNVEAGLKWDLTPELGLTMAAYRLDRSNTRASDPVTGNAVLSGKSRAKGFEIALAGRLTRDWQMTAGYARQDGEVRAAITAAPAGRRLAQLPRHQLSLWSRYEVTHRLGLGLGLTHQSGQFATISNAVFLPSFTRIDAAVYFKASDALTFQLNAENLTDRHYYPSAHTDFNISTGEPLNVRLTARIRL